MRPMSRPETASPFLVAALAVLALAACDDGTGAPAGPEPTPNRPPLPSGTVSAQTVPVGQTITVDVAANFTDPDGDVLTYAAASSNVGIASVSVSGSGVAVTGVAAGGATVTATASAMAVRSSSASPPRHPVKG